MDGLAAAPASGDGAGVSTFYPLGAGLSTRMLLLNADRSPIANTIVISAAAPDYDPAGRAGLQLDGARLGAARDPDGREVR